MEHFQIWMMKFEKQNGVEFIKVTRNLNIKSKVTYYRCNRSGFSKVSTKRVQRRTKTQGSCKIQGYCTAYIRTKEDLQTGVVSMNMCNTHYGHERQVIHLRIPKQDKQIISDKLSKGLSLADVVQDIKKSDCPNSTTRTNMIKTRDVYNVLKKLGANKSNKANDSISSTGIKHETNSFRDEPDIFCDSDANEKYDHCNNSNKNNNLVDSREPNQCMPMESIEISPISEDTIPSFLNIKCERVIESNLHEIHAARSQAVRYLEQIVENLEFINDLETLLETCAQSEALKIFVKGRISSTNQELESAEMDVEPVGKILDSHDSHVAVPLLTQGVKLERRNSVQYVTPIKMETSACDELVYISQNLRAPSFAIPVTQDGGLRYMTNTATDFSNDDQRCDRPTTKLSTEPSIVNSVSTSYFNYCTDDRISDEDSHNFLSNSATAGEETQDMAVNYTTTVDSVLENLLREDHLIAAGSTASADSIITDRSLEPSVHMLPAEDPDDEEEAVLQAPHSFSADGKTCFIHVDKENVNRLIRIVLT